jgi:hypothetical protein
LLLLLQAEVDALRAQLAQKEQQLAAAAEAVAEADIKIVSGTLLLLRWLLLGQHPLRRRHLRALLLLWTMRCCC